MTRLSLEGCGLKQLPPELTELCSLAELNLRRNRLFGLKGFDSAADPATKWAALEQLTALTHLDARDCELRAVPATFGALSRLQVLRLTDNHILGRYGWLGKLNVRLDSLPCVLLEA